MKVLIGYDGSSYADAAVDDLMRAGLGSEVEVLVASVADFKARQPAFSEFDLVSAASSRIDAVFARGARHHERVLMETGEIAERAARRIRERFPEWDVRTEVLRGDPAEALLQTANSWEADVIVVGSQGRSAIGRFFLGSVAKSVSENAAVPVRVVRRDADKGNSV